MGAFGSPGYFGRKEKNMNRKALISATLAFVVGLALVAGAAYGTKARWENTYLIYYDADTWETIRAVSPMWHSSDFTVPALDTTNSWCAWDYQGGTETLLADQPQGVVQLLLSSANESQTAGIDYNDEKQIRAAYGPSIEFRMRFTTLPAGSTTAVWGLYGSRNDALDSITESIWFRADGSGAITVENDDGTNETSKVATGITVVADAWHIYRIDLHENDACRFYIDGGQVATGSTFDMSTSSTLQLQPGAVMTHGHPSDLGVMEIDYVRFWGKRS